MTSAIASESDFSPNPKYRPDIDGLRAIAVLCVVVFHAFPDALKGGFIGVDVFFVISGYLISTIIFNEISKNKFSFSDFYIRRIKRIFPALILVLSVSIFFAWFLLYPNEYGQFGKHVAAGAGFVSNLIFWQESGYFDNASEMKPLLHLWSLGIEEQFYIVWPIFLWMAWKWRLNFLVVTLILVVVSFALNIVQVRDDAVAAFYSPQTRFWELLAGSVLAYLQLGNKDNIAIEKSQESGWIYSRLSASNRLLICNILSFFGLALMVLGLLVTHKARSFPGWWALFPTMATVLMIAVGSRTWLNRVILSHRWLVGVGLISFPLYLWHWPLLSFAHIIFGPKIPVAGLIFLVLTSFVLAGLTYLWIEKPIRLKRCNFVSARTLLVGMLIIGSLGYLGSRHEGSEWGFAPKSDVLNEGDVGHDFFHGHKSIVKNLCTQYAHSPVACFNDEKTPAEKIAVIGDSHADHLAVGLAGQLPAKNVVFFDALGLPLFIGKDGTELIHAIMRDEKVKSVILSASWYARLNAIDAASSLHEELLKVVDALAGAGKKVYIVDDVPNFSFPPQKCHYSGTWLRVHQCSEGRDYFFEQYKKYFPGIESISSLKNVELIRLAPYFCDENFCRMDKNGVLFYRDNNHLNLKGTEYAAQKVLQDHPQLADRP